MKSETCSHCEKPQTHTTQTVLFAKDDHKIDLQISEHQYTNADYSGYVLWHCKISKRLKYLDSVKPWLYWYCLKEDMKQPVCCRCWIFRRCFVGGDFWLTFSESQPASSLMLSKAWEWVMQVQLHVDCNWKIGFMPQDSFLTVQFKSWVLIEELPW